MRGRRKAEAASSSEAARPQEEEEPSNHDNNNEEQPLALRRSLRAKYRALKDNIAASKDCFLHSDSEHFDNVISDMQNLHNMVQHPREQVADAETLLAITSTFLESVKNARQSGITPAEFVVGILWSFRGAIGKAEEDELPKIDWGALGLHASAIFSDAPGLMTMLGPMESEPKFRKPVTQRRKRDRSTTSTRPEEIKDSAEGNEKTETDKNMEVMFRVLKKTRSVPLEAIVLNRRSFSQTVENIFALSFLVKDGRAKIWIENEQHMVAPKNYPSAEQREKGEGSMSQFVFRFDFIDWKGMCNALEEGKEMIPHRGSSLESSIDHLEGLRTPVRVNSRNRAKQTPLRAAADMGIAETEEEDVKPNRRRIRSCNLPVA